MTQRQHSVHREPIARALRDLFTEQRRTLGGDSNARQLGAANYALADAILDAIGARPEVTVSHEPLTFEALIRPDGALGRLIDEHWPGFRSLLGDDEPKPDERGQHAEPMTGEDAEWFGQHVYVTEPSRYWPEGTECPIHERVHNAHGWYVCLPVVRPDQAEAIHKIERMLFERNIKGGTTAEIVQRLIIELRQYREAHSHAQQLRDHYTAALSALLIDVERADGDTAALQAACVTAKAMLENPPEWDMRLRS